MPYLFEIPGDAIPKQSARHMVSKFGKLVSYQPKKLENNRQSIGLYVKNSPNCPSTPFSSPVRVIRLWFLFTPLKNKPKWYNERIREFDDGTSMLPEFPYKDTRPDLDNLMKQLWDSLEGVLFLNDSQIVHLGDVRKGYSFRPRIVLEVEEIK